MNDAPEQPIRKHARNDSMQRILLAALAALLLSGCSGLLRTDYKRPELNVPAQWSVTASNATTANATAANAARAGAGPAAWPKDFGDPELARLVDLALERNNDLAAAAIRVRQARIAAGLAQDDLLPDLAAGLSTSHEKDLKHGGDWDNAHTASAKLSYEADLWGKLSRTYDAAQWEAAATEEDRQAAALSLVGSTMKFYWQIAYYNVRLDLSGRNIAASEQTLDLVAAQERYGAASELEVNEARQNLISLKSDRQALLQSRQEAVNGLTVLFDMPPGKVMADPQQLAVATLPTIPAGLPADLLGRRPDLRAAEKRLRELLANTDAARAGFFPTLALTGSLGSSSAELVHVLENPVATFTSAVALPFLNWNNLRLKQKQAQAKYDEAVVNFRQTLYGAMQEVANALSNRRLLAEQGGLLEENLTAARAIEDTYEVRYRTGYGTMKDWLDAQNTRRTAEQSLATNLYDRLVNFVTLYQALGGAPRLPETAGATEAGAADGA
jgi:NodT family efflux transporter outer membrane factor (OMF) lipoprotein